MQYVVVLDDPTLRCGAACGCRTGPAKAHNAANAMSPTQWGYFYRTSSEIPHCRASGRKPDVRQGLHGKRITATPEQDPRPKKKPTTPTAPAV